MSETKFKLKRREGCGSTGRALGSISSGEREREREREGTKEQKKDGVVQVAGSACLASMKP
jgi:hypothetical protein